ncbi:MAG TPA: ABC transporter substrate-binding protein [Candidatus Acidoferrales bacterium]|nr:ABC transporter substrate-binding protein [Candidatus Acidoferrales bacterium]
MRNPSLADFIRGFTRRLFFPIVLCLVFSPADAATTLVDFPIGYSSNGGTYGFIGLVQQQRLLEQQGIRPQFIYIGGIQITQAFIAGDILMEIVAAASPIRAAAHGTDLRFIGGAMDREVLTLVTSPAIKTPADLKNTKLAIDRLGDYSDFLARTVLGKLNLIPEKDVTLIQIGSQTSRFAAVKSGLVQATFVGPPLTLLAQQAGLNLLVDLASLGIPSSSASFVVLRSTQQRRGSEIYRALAALGKGLRLYKANKDAAIKGLAQFMQLKDQAALEDTWRVHARLYKDVPSPSVEGIKVVKDFLGKTDPSIDKLSMTSLVDTQYVNQLEREIDK